jgi:ABC-type oligopeptide transport system substrate-binding subunit/transcriptional regulator with XRE-family HTH domain
MRDRDGHTARSAVASFGYHVRRRRLALDLTQAALAKRVGCSAATIKKIEHDQRRPSRRMAARLAESLELPDDLRERFVSVAVGEDPPRILASTGAATAAAAQEAPHAMASSGPPPTWLTATTRSRGDPLADRFVEREAELARLGDHLASAVEGRGRVVFVTGEAGQGKTALLTAFAARAHETVPDLVVASGFGTAAGGIADPYLPFRDLFLMLLADPQARWQADRLQRGQAERLWRFAPRVASTLLTSAPELLDVLVPAASVHERARRPMPDDGSPEALRGGVVRDRLFAQVTSALHALAEQQPLLLLLDDLQWIDAASAELLFHLARRIGTSRILLVGAYRDSEVSAEAEPASEILRRTRLEVRRDLGEVGIDLEDVAADEARRLCDALVDREPNRLDDRFRERLFEQTRGQPLFTLELLRELRSRDDLVRDGEGRWVLADTLDWGGLPDRVAAVIEQRLARLDDRPRAVLDVAAVVGEQFSAEVVAVVCGVGEGELLRLMSSELADVHGLIRETGVQKVRGGQLNMWRFSHALFPAYLYDRLGVGERRYLHHEVATELAAIHGSDDAVAPRLAYHYTEAGEGAAAVPYLLRAGDHARRLYANDEAAHHYRRAVGFLRDLGDAEKLARTLMKLGLTYQTAFDHVRAQEAYDDAFRLWRDASTTRSPLDAPAALRMIWREPPSLDPTMGGYNLTAPVAMQLFSGLVAFGEEGEILPDVAERWELEDGGRRYVFHLRDDVSWSDGVPVTAHDFAFTYRRGLDPATGAFTASALLDAVRGARAVRAGTPIDEVELGLRAEDDRTLVIELEEPTSYFIQNLAYYVLLPAPRHRVEEHGEAWSSAEHLVGNGPFLVTSWEPGRSMTLERNARYHGASTGNVGRIDLDLEAAEEDHAELYATDRLDVVRDWFTPAAVVRELARRFPDDYLVQPQLTTSCYLVNGTRPPLDDVRVRRALAMAVDRDAIAALMPPDSAAVATGGVVPPGMPGHVPGIQPVFDPEQARRALSELGVVGGGAVEPTLRVPQRGVPLAEALASAWGAVGLTCRIEVDDGVAGADAAEDASWDVSAGGWVADYADPDNFLRVFVGLNLDRAPDGYHALLARAATSLDQAERLALYEEAERLLAEEALLVPLVYRDTALLVKPWVQRFVTPAVKHVGFWQDVVVGGHDTEGHAASS